MGRVLKKLQSRLAQPSSKRMTSQLRSLSDDRKLDSSHGVLTRLISSCQPPSRSTTKFLYIMSVEQLNDPLIAQLLQQAAEEYGYSRPGILEVSCDGATLDKILRILKSSQT
ncbi:hypothetical protein KP509_1Z024100 [Ceratopteris richardii]|nr:hypothetical protein KP509_1Z272500 [Ceratopteris richardii]KAH6556215.1 hypothetical protein KP509_1Z196600 [Ceratopteris richardii]KAH6556217.1 hypothetical protein KP509_1Z196800 [Ceratopteris richardii]KAH6559196.1 hypothetical protein KP509_1Z024100 [Ceratopteris richardii]